jgi:hypothetical protein
MGLGTSVPGGLLELSSDASGTLAGEVLLQRIRSNTAVNTAFVDVKSRRHTAGSDWTGLGFRLQHQVDGTPMGFLEFNSLVSGQDVAIGAGGSTRLLVNSSGNVLVGYVCLSTASYDLVQANDTSGRLLVGTSSARSGIFSTGVSSCAVPGSEGTSVENAYASIATLEISANSANPVQFTFLQQIPWSLLLAPTRGVVAAVQIRTRSEVCLWRGQTAPSLYELELLITAEVDGTPGANDMPGRIVLSTTAVGASSPTEAMRINNAGELLVGYTADNGAYKLQVNSQIFATSATIATSDGRYKENVATLDGCVDLVKALRPVSFDWKEQQNITRIDDDGNEVLVREGHNFPDGTQVGFIAQEVEEVLTDKPWLGSVIKQNVRPAVTDNDGNELAPEEEFLGIAEGNLVAVLTSALQEAIGEIESLKARLTAAGI